MRLLYELAARTDCANQRRLANMTVFIDPARNPDGRDNNTRTTAFSFDANRDLAFQTQDVNAASLDEINTVPGPRSSSTPTSRPAGYFFPPDEDPGPARDLRTSRPTRSRTRSGPALQERFNDQGLQYRNYNAYDLFSNEYGDTGAVAVHGRRRHDVREGLQRGLRQAGLRPLPGDGRDAQRRLQAQGRSSRKEWASQWAEAAAQGAACELQENRLDQPAAPAAERRDHPAARPTRSAATTSRPASTPATSRGSSTSCAAATSRSTRSTRPSRSPARTTSARPATKAQTLPAGTHLHPGRADDEALAARDDGGGPVRRRTRTSTTSSTGRSRSCSTSAARGSCSRRCRPARS